MRPATVFKVLTVREFAWLWCERPPGEEGLATLRNKEIVD
jgi:hypothetical protein